MDGSSERCEMAPSPCKCGGGGGQKFKSDCNIVAVGANKRVIYFEYVCKASGNDTNSGYSSMLKLLSLLGHQ